MSAFEPVYDDDGDLIAHLTQADDGAVIILDADAANIIGVQDPTTGEDLDPSGYALNDGAEDTYDPMTALDARLDAIEAAVNEPRDMLVTRGLEVADVDRVERDMTVQAEHLEAALGRPLLIDERRRIAAQVYDDIEAGDSRPDLYDAAHKSGGLLDLDGGTRGQNHEARTQFMAQRLADQERLSAQDRGEDDVSFAEPPAQRESFDLDDRAQRQQYMADRMRGATDADAAFSSSQLQDEDW